MRAFIGLGSNISPAVKILNAVNLLRSRLKILDISTVYRTRAIGKKEAPDFYNCVVEIETETPPQELKKELRNMEKELGRVRKKDKYAPRVIDMDILIYDTLISDEERIPDPEILKRPFLLAGLAELAPEMQFPGTREKIKDLAQGINGLKPLPSYTSRLRKELNGPEKSRRPDKRTP